MSTKYRLVGSIRRLRPGSVEAQRHRLRSRRLVRLVLRCCQLLSHLLVQLVPRCHLLQSRRLLAVLLRHRPQSHRLPGLLQIVFVLLTTSLLAQVVRVA